MMFRLLRSIAIPLAVHTALFVLVVSGALDRTIVPFWTLALLIWALLAAPQTSIVFFVAAIPLFIAIPITPEYDNLTMWRPLSIVIFLRWFLSSYSRSDIARGISRVLRELPQAPRRYPIASALAVLAITAGLSLTVAPDISSGIRRIIFFSNAALVPIALFALLRHNDELGRRMVGAIAFSAVSVTVVAFIQLASTYVLDIYQFMYVWGEGIQLRQFGTLWSEIAIRLGNTWLAYYGEQLSLRVFSLFPDSHSFPIYLIFALAGLMALSVRTLLARAGDNANFGKLMRTRANLGVVWVPLALLAIILSGTRGIWLAAAGLPFVTIFIWRLLRNSVQRRPIWLWLSSFIVVVALLFVVAWPIFISPQFLLSKGDLSLFRERIRSIIDFGETSNSQRLAIWSQTLDSIAARPLRGIGIGNFPAVLDQRIFLARAGSSAHNIYLHIASEMGLIALGAWLWLWITLYRYTLVQFRLRRDGFWLGYYGWMLLAIPWVAAYLFTDAALFDERALLLFGVSAALIVPRSPSNDA